MRTAALAAAAFLVTLASSPAAAFTLTILHTNDVHSRIEPINKYGSTCAADAPAEECFGGFARLATAVEARRAASDADAVLLLDAGDQFQGSLFYTTYKGLAAAELMNAVGYDAMAVGNHEFDDGPEALAAFVDAVGFPVISSNVDASAEPLLAGKIPGAAVIALGGERIGIVSAVATDTAELSSPGPNVEITDDLAAIEAAVAALEAEGVTRIVALTHVGLTRDLRIAEIPGVDVVIGGHSHTLLSNSDPAAVGPYPAMVETGNGATPVAQAGSNGAHLGELTVVFDADGRVASAAGDPILLDASFEPDPALAARIAALAGPIEALKSEVVGRAAERIDGSRETCRLAECAMGNLVADAMLERTKAQGVEIAIQNGGGLRASIDAGPVTMGEVLTVLPFQNTLATFTISGADILAALENGVSEVEEGAGRFPQVAGMRFAWDPGAPPGSRIVRAETRLGNGGWAELEPDLDYLVVSNDFMRRGGDGYAVFAENGRDAYDFGPALDRVLADFIAETSPVRPGVDGRIVVETGG